MFITSGSGQTELVPAIFWVKGEQTRESSDASANVYFEPSRVLLVDLPICPTDPLIPPSCLTSAYQGSDEEAAPSVPSHNRLVASPAESLESPDASLCCCQCR